MHITDQYELTEDQFDDLDNGIQDNKNDKDDTERGKAPAVSEDIKTKFLYQSEEINLLKAQLEAMKNKIKELEAPKVIVVEKIDPIQKMISELLEEQKEINKLASKKKAPTKKIKTDPKKFELFLNDLDDLCN